MRYQALGLLWAARYALLDAQAAKQRDAGVLGRLLKKALRRSACISRGQFGMGRRLRGCRAWPKPSRLVETSVDELPSPPLSNTGVVAIEATLAAVAGRGVGQFQSDTCAQRPWGFQNAATRATQLGFVDRAGKAEADPERARHQGSISRCSSCRSTDEAPPSVCALSQGSRCLRGSRCCARAVRSLLR